MLAILFAHHLEGVSPAPEGESPEVQLMLKLISGEFAPPPYSPPMEKENKKETSPQTPCKEINKERVLSPSRSCISINRAEELFQSFWSAYPRKVGKQAARRKFAAIMRKLDEAEASALLSRMLKAVNAQAQSEQWSDMAFIPHPTTWLNQGRWEDEAEAPRRTEADIASELAAKYF